jgi:tetratricopeptide (TPR) repeat protein
MSDPLRTDTLGALDGVSDSDRDAKIEQLLLIGLDHYFAAHHEQAINVWTRVLFLDRSHARARAYIDRARSALAERQRESEELLQRGMAAFERGEGDEARELIRTAISQGAQPDEALAVLDRLNRLEHGVAVPQAASPSRAGRSRAGAIVAARRTQSALRGFGWIAAVLVLVAGGLLAAQAARAQGARYPNWRSLALLDMFDRVTSGAAAAADPVQPRLALPRRGETALARARALETSGHLRDALAALEDVRLADPERADADRLRADLQRQLMTLGDSRLP